MKRWVLAAALLAIASLASAADEDSDLALIPQSNCHPGRCNRSDDPGSRFTNGRIFLEDALTYTSSRDDSLPRWEDRLLADVRLEFPIASNAHAAYSGRLNVLAQDGLGFPHRANANNDLRELYASIEPQPRSYLDAGRINLKSGVALGFNPTDFFKARAVVDPLTADPSSLRGDRLGTVMARAQHVGEASSWMAVYAPRVTAPAALATDPDRGFNPLWGRTNGNDRWLAKASMQLGDGVNPEVLAFHENGRWKAGFNIAESVGQGTVVYLEWSGGRRAGLIDEALGFGRETGTIPPTAPNLVAPASAVRFRSQAAIGASYTTESKVTFNLEYHYNGAGVARVDSLPAVRELAYVRAYAADRQEPLQRDSVFVRADWVDAFVPHLELTGFVLADAHDGSALVQLEAEYARTDLWSFGVLAGGTTGSKRSNFGSLPRSASLLFKATRYF